MNRNVLLLIGGALLLFWLLSGTGGGGGERQFGKNELAYSTFIEYVQSGKIKKVIIDEEARRAYGPLDGGGNYVTYTPRDLNLVPFLTSHGVETSAIPPSDPNSLSSILLSWFPMLLLIGVWVYFMRSAQGKGGRGGPMGMFGQSPAKLLTKYSGTRVTFEDVAGVEEAKQELVEVVEFLKDPHKFQRLGGKIPKGVLLVGPPGTGKTLLAKAIAGEADVPFFSTSGSAFVEMFVGVGASRVRDMFEQGKKNAPCIIFIDEIDAMGRHRGAGVGGGHDEKEQTLNQLLTEMDGFETNEGVILIAATNRPDVLDPALIRPGRFDRQVVVPKPDVLGREKILKVHMQKVPLASNVKPLDIARGTPGLSGADLANIVNEAALLAARNNKNVVTMQDFEAAKDKVLMGSERRSVIIPPWEREMTAYHEAGHAIVGHFVKGNDPVYQISIIPRGMALGVTMTLPKEDRYMAQKRQLKAQIAMLFGGRVAEELFKGKEKITTGAANDIQKATELTRNMVAKWGMSKKAGPIRFEGNEEEVFLGRSVTQRKNMSEQTAQLIDAEVKKLITLGERTARLVLRKKRAELDILAKALLEFETVSGEEMQMLFDGKPIIREGLRVDSDIKTPRGSVPSSGKKPKKEIPDEDPKPDTGVNE